MDGITPIKLSLSLASEFDNNFVKDKFDICCPETSEKFSELREIMSFVLSFVSELQWVSVWLLEWEWALESKFTTLDFEWQTIRFSALLTQFSTGTVLVETSLLMKWSCVVLTDGNDWPCNVLLVSNWVNSLLTDGMERPCDKKGPMDGTCPKWDISQNEISQNEIYEQFWKYNTQYPPFIIFLMGKCRKHYNPKCILCGKFQQLNATGTKWHWASTINHWMNTPKNCQEKSQKMLN